MARRAAGLYRTWPRIVLIFAGLLTTAEGARYGMLGWLIAGTGVVLTLHAVRRNRAIQRAARTAARHAARIAAASAVAGNPAQDRQRRPARQPRNVADRGSRRSATGRRLGREFIRLLP